MTAALISGFLLMFAVPDGIGGLALKWRGFETRAACEAEAPAILARPINLGAVIVSACEPGEFAPGGRGDVYLGRAEA